MSVAAHKPRNAANCLSSAQFGVAAAAAAMSRDAGDGDGDNLKVGVAVAGTGPGAATVGDVAQPDALRSLEVQLADGSVAAAGAAGWRVDGIASRSAATALPVPAEGPVVQAV